MFLSPSKKIMKKNILNEDINFFFNEELSSIKGERGWSCWEGPGSSC